MNSPLSRPRRVMSRPLTAAATLLTALTTAAALAACGPPDTSGATDLPTSEEELVAMAKEEGEVVLGAGGHTRAQAQLLADKFTEKYGIKVTFVRENSGDIAQKTQAQLTAGSPQFDVVSLNDEATLRVWEEEDVLADPAIADRDAILAPLRGEETQSYLPFTWGALGYSYNEASVDPATAPKTWKELAERSDTFAVADPRSSGAALTFVAAMERIDGGFLPGLGDADTLVTDSALALTQLVATGEADFGIPGVEADIATAREAGEPLTIGYPEGEIGAVPSYVGALAQAQHPAAARLLVRFQLSEEFQAAQVEAGSRAVLSGLPEPEEAEELTEDRLVVVDARELSERKDELVQAFSSAVGS
ncbi:iron(III) transport system substrate-binding protein [Prauserella marina]|uniref:Iron(III) transport system substrate-binding protein n=2 Tax=Prauserella marina TaxID=530584 RepID=A0A1G6IXA6_9PSEU|nr:iron(III) transport system substrate-binding protein [Prauserella marina]SDC11119.1 iron(III) transport system substrate-binding protein [Prauserella marina]